MNKLLSIVIPTYNMEELLPRCLDSLVNPFCPDKLEILVINDGSKDNSLHIAKQYEIKYPGNVIAVDKPNGNYGSAINKGIEIATGKYIKILDADDFYNHEGLCQLIKHLEKIDADMILTSFRRDRGKEKVCFSSPFDRCNRIMDFRNVDLMKFPNFKMHAITYKASILKDNNIKLQTGISYTDSEFCFYPIPYIKTFIALDILVYCYQIGREGQTVDIKSQIRSINHMIIIIQRMHKSLMNNKNNTSIFEKQRIIFCDVASLIFLTVLCFDKSDNNLDKLREVCELIASVNGANELLMNVNLFGIRYYKRFVINNKTSNGLFLSCYYKIVKLIAPAFHFYMSLSKK